MTALLPINRRRLLTLGAAALAIAAQAAASAAAPPPRRRHLPVSTLDDSSRLNATPIARHAIVGASDDARLLRELRMVLGEALPSGRAVAVGGARHSQGGQSLPRHGMAVTLAAPRIDIDSTALSYQVSAGARWRDVIATLGPRGFSPAVMQSNNDFSVGGTLSVNAHGWPAPFGPFAATVRAFRLMLADGAVLRCAPDENAELFGLALGGYGLFGVVIDCELAMVANDTLSGEAEALAAHEAGPRLLALAGQDGTRMVYGRLSVARQGFLEQALLVRYRPAPDGATPSRSASMLSAYAFASRQLFRAQTGSEAAKRARWTAETRLAPRLAREAVRRNTLLDTPVAALEDRDRARTDILHEYFLPPERLRDFLAACRAIVPAHRPDLLNVTLRYVDTDSRSVLRYAPAPRIAAVMLFVQERSRAADDDMRAMTEKLIDAVLAQGGSYYLPYRLHARGDQLRAAYPEVERFADAKRRYDPKLRFRNALWDRYLATL